MRRIGVDFSIATALIAAFGLCCAAGLYHAAAPIGLPVPLDPDEGWNAYLQASAISGGALYPPANGFLINNYPPLSFYLIGGLGSWLGDNIVAGRIVSLASFLFLTAAIAACARAMDAQRTCATLGTLYFAAVLLLFSDYVAMNDPQLLGHAIQISGLYLLIRERRSAVTVFVAALLFVASVFVKHNLVALPLAALVWLFAYDRKAALRFGLAGAIFGALGLLAFRLTYGTSLLPFLASARSYSLGNIERRGLAALPWVSVPSAGSALLVYFAHTDKFAVFCVLYAVIALGASLFFLGGAGVDVNVLFDAAIALSLGAALVLERVAKSKVPALAAIVALYLVPLALTRWLMPGSEWLSPEFWTHPLGDEAQTARADIALLRDHPGPALCETLALCYWAGKGPAVDVFNLGEAFRKGARSDRELLNRIDRGDFAIIEFEEPPPFGLGDNVDKAVERNYRVLRIGDDGIFLAPRKSG
jgi:hypothetical protein